MKRVTVVRRGIYTVDLHGLTVHDALQLLDRAIFEALRDGESSLEVIHGRGSGVLRAAVRQALETEYAHSVDELVTTPLNDGCVMVRFRRV